MEGAFSGRVVVVTGAARGLGRDYARFFAADGANVVLAEVRNLDGALAEVEAAASGSRCMAVEADVTDRSSVDALVGRAVDELGRFDVLVNHAGLWRGLSAAGLLYCPPQLWQAAWAVNMTGTLLSCQAAVPAMAANGFGRVVNMSSMASRSGGNPYGVTKNAVEHMTKGMVREVGHLGITVNCVAPGISASEAAKDAVPDAADIVATIAVPRLGTSRDLYAALAYLCSEAASWVTGEVLRVDGGSRTG